MIGHPPKHDTIRKRQVRLASVQRLYSSIEHNRQLRPRRLQAEHTIVVQRRHIPVLLWRQAFQPGFSRMHDEGRAAGCRDGIDKAREISLGVLIVNTDAAFDRDRNINGAPHGRDAARHQLRLGHKTSPEPPILHPIRRATAVEVDLVIAKARPDLGRARQVVGVGAAKLQRHWMFGCIEPKQPPLIAVQDGAGGDHLSIEQRARRQQTVENPAMPVGPIHQRCNAESM